MDSYTNHTPGPRGINIKGGITIWIEPGQTVEIDQETIVGDVPDLGRPHDAGAKADAANVRLAAQVDELTAKVFDLQEQLDAANAKIAATPPSEPGPLDQSVEKLTAYLEGVTDADEVERLIEAETAGKSRAGAIAALEARRDALLA